MSRSSTKTLAILAVTVFCGTVAAVLLNFYLSMYIDVTVKVVDGNTGLPVANAKVMVTVWNTGIIESQPIGISGVTDQNGEVRITGKSPFVVGYFGCEAAAPGKYAENHRIEGNVCVLRLQPLPASFLRNGEPIPQLTYQHFSGRWGHSEALRGEPQN